MAMSEQKTSPELTVIRDAPIGVESFEFAPRSTGAVTIQGFINNSAERQDHAGYSEQDDGTIVAAVSDGFSTAARSDEASATAVREFIQKAGSIADVDIPNLLQGINRSVRRKVDRWGKATLTGLVYDPQREHSVTVTSIGDSRAYLIEDNSLYLITKDTVDENGIVTKAMGTEGALQISMQDNMLQFGLRDDKDSYVVLVTDGIGDMLDVADMKNEFPGEPELDNYHAMSRSQFIEAVKNGDYNKLMNPKHPTDACMIVLKRLYGPR